MPWSHDRPSPRNRTRPSDWKARRAAVLHRDQVCYHCQRPGSDQVDHVIPVSRWERDRLPGDPHHPDNLAAAHTDCVRQKTAHEAAAARPTRKRPPERHPGLL
jgi:5-methylcytosine-specific restriction protein A